ncbi:MAG TPA: hypothetical protein VK011_00070 [Acidimicrobiia bacterium]|nr:hypothetical protein [Acidimicrobiia bacterium]
MHTFYGTLQGLSNGDGPLSVGIQFDGGRVRMWSDRRRLGSWDLADVRIRRESIFRFVLIVDGQEYRFSPDDPSGFAESVDVEIDLTAEEKPRFGLADRIRQVEAT